MAFVEVTGLAKTYGKVTAVNGISFGIERGHCVALLGPNGAGKTTSLNMLAGLLRPTAGSISFQGLAPGGDRRTLIGYLPQETAIFGWMTGSEYLRMIGELFGLSRGEAAKRADELLDTLSLGEARRRRVGGYSGGMKQRLGLAQALVSRPQLLILDEPVSGLDPVGRRDVLELLKQLKTTTTIVFSTHVLPDAEELSDDVLIIRGGSVIVSGTMEALRERYQMPIVEVEFDSSEDAARWRQSLAAIGGALEQQGALMRCRFETPAQMRDGADAVYRLIAAEHINVRRVETGQTTLEDMFLKAVEQ